MVDEIKELIEYGVMQVVAGLTVEGTLWRSAWIWLARHSMLARRWLFLRDTWELMHGDTLPGEVVLEWADQRSALSMAEQIVEQIRKAPRAYGVTNFILEVGERDVKQTGTMDSVWSESVLAMVTQFLSDHDPKKDRVVRLTLLGQTLAAVKQRYQWSA
jgi:hypothetical protein